MANGNSERITHSETLGKLAAAKARAHIKFLPLGKDKEASVFSQRTGKTFTYSYADLSTCLDSVIPALADEGIALFQPVRVDLLSEQWWATATTLLVHGESNEWYSSEFACPITDPSDARSVGSAATYARRYGLLSTLGIASSDEDDDAEAARGGAHDMKEPVGAKACPACGVVGSIIKSKPEFGGGWLCWKGKDGCGTKWPAGPFPTSAPLEQEMMPRRTDKWQGESPPNAGDPKRGPGRPRKAQETPAVAPPVETPPLAAEAPQEAQESVEQAPDEAPKGPVTVFLIGEQSYATNGITKEQMLQTFELAPKADKKLGKGWSRKLCGKILGVATEQASRNQLTEAQAAKFLEGLQQAIV